LIVEYITCSKCGLELCHSVILDDYFHMIRTKEDAEELVSNFHKPELDVKEIEI